MYKKSCRLTLFLVFALFISNALFAERLHSPTHLFSVDLPEGYTLVSGDGKNLFSFADSMSSAALEISIYAPDRFTNAEAALRNAILQLGATGDIDRFNYYGRDATIANLRFTLQGREEEAWALAMPLGLLSPNENSPQAIILALAHAPTADRSGKPLDQDLILDLHLSTLNSLSPSPRERLYPGPIATYAWPPEEGKREKFQLFNLDLETLNEDAEANQTIVDREARILARYAESPLWLSAWERFYRAIYRDAYERVRPALFELERYFSANIRIKDSEGPYILATNYLSWVQSFSYERDLAGSDFVNIVTALREGRGDCDSRALLLAICMDQAGVPAHIMVSLKHAHALALIDIDAEGARFSFKEKRWLVAETTAKVELGRIAQNQAAEEDWYGINLSF